MRRFERHLGPVLALALLTAACGALAWWGSSPALIALTVPLGGLLTAWWFRLQAPGLAAAPAVHGNSVPVLPLATSPVVPAGTAPIPPVTPAPLPVATLPFGRVTILPAASSAQALAAALAAEAADTQLIVDQDDLIRGASSALAASLALPAATLHGCRFSDLLLPADRQRWQECVVRLHAGDDPVIALGRLRLWRADPQQDVIYLDVSLVSGRVLGRSNISGGILNSSITSGGAASDDTPPAQSAWAGSGSVGPPQFAVGPGDHTLICARDVSAVVAAERALARVETRYSLLYHNSPDAILLVRAADRLVLDFNAAFTRLFDIAREQGIGVRLDALDGLEVPPHLLQFLEGVHARVDINQQRMHFVAGPNRQRIDARVSAGFGDIDGELAVIVIIRDVTERREAEQALRDSEQKFTLVFNAAPDGISITRLVDGVLIDVNDQLCAASGYAREELLGRNLGEMGIVDDQRDLYRALRLLQRYGSFRDIEMTLISKNGERVPALASATQVDIGGEPCVVTIAKDIRGVRRAEQALRNSEARFRGAFEDAPLGMALVDSHLQLIEGNYWLADMMGIALGKLPARNFTDLLVPEERGDLEVALLRLLDTEDEHLRREQRLQRPDGEYRHATLHAVVQQDGEGEAKYLIVQLADVTDIKRSQEQMERLAFYDPLTNLANRRLFMDRLEQTMQHAARSGRPAALFYLDLDQFKKVNDELGHDIGDELLKIVAERLRTCVRREDTVGRPGGDEFNIVLHEVRDADAAAHVAEHVLTVLREPMRIDGHQLTITITIGIAMIPDDGSDAGLLVQRADQAMYRAKQQGRNTYRFYGDAVNARAVERLNFETALERALLGDELTLLYQPVYDVATDALYAVEALLRWQHPERGILQPALFLDVTEHSGLLRALDMWVLRKACRQLQALDQLGVHVPAVAVSIANRHISDPDLPRTIEQLLAECGLAKTRVHIEIGESVLAREADAAQHWLEALREHGLHLTIDDFGATIGSLNAISRLPVQNVKLDSSVVHRLTSSREAALMADTVVAVCAALGREVIADGVQTQEQRDRLLRAGCRYAQGPFFGPPLTGSGLTEALRPARSPASVAGF